MYIVKELEWMREYIELSKRYVYNTRYLKRISSVKPREGSIQQCHAITTKYYDGYNFRITFYTHYKSIITEVPDFSYKVKPYSKIDFLVYLAHELSHLKDPKHWDHTPEHKMLEADLIRIFMLRLKDSGYVSEEEELK